MNKRLKKTKKKNPYTSGKKQGQDNTTVNTEEIKLTGVSFNVNIFNKKTEDDSQNKLRINQLIRAGHNFTTVLQMLWKS